MFFLTYLRRELRRRRRQAIVVALGLALGIGLTVTVSAVSAGVQTAQQKVLHSLYGVGTDISVTQAAQQGTGGPQRFNVNGQNNGDRKTFSTDRVTAAGGTATFAASAVDKIAKQRHVSAAAGGLTLTDLKLNGQFAQGQGNSGTGSNGGGFTRGGTGSGSGSQPTARPSQPPINVDTFSIAGVDLAHPGVGPLSSVDVAKGRSFATGDATSKVAVLSASFAKQRSKTVGETLTISGTAYTIIGTVTSTGTSTTDVYLPLAAAQSLASLPGKINTVYVKATSSTAIDAASTEIKSVLPAATVTTSSDLAKEVSGSLGSASSLVSKLGLWLSVAVLVAAFVLAVLFTISAVARRVREFGTLKALGWRTRRIVGQVLGESLVQGLIGGALGIGLGFLGAFIVNRVSPTLTATTGGAGNQAGGTGGPGGGGFGGGFARTAAQTVDVHLSASVTFTAVVLAVALAIAGGLLAGLFGGWRASRMRPADALRRVE